MKIAFVEDDSTELDILRNTINNALEKSDISVEKTDCFDCGESFLKEWTPYKYDIVILDIYMAELNGIDVAKKIREQDKKSAIVFCSSSNEFAGESYALNAAYYLKKPISINEISTMLKRIGAETYELSRFITLPDSQKLILRNIVFAQHFNHRVIIHLKNSQNISTRLTMTEFEKLIENEKFLVSCAKGIVVNMYEIEKQTENAFVMKDGTDVPISRRKFKDMQKTYADFVFARMRKEIV